MTRATKPWIGTAISAAGLGLAALSPAVAVAVGFVGYFIAVFTTAALNTARTRLAVYCAAALNAAALYLGSGSLVLAIGLMVIAAPIHSSPWWSRVWPTAFDVTSFVLFLVGIPFLLLAGPVGWWRVGLGVYLAVLVLFMLLGTKNLKDDRVFNVAGTKVRVGAPVPDFSLPFRRGDEVFTLSEERGRPLVLAWLRGDWCPICQMMLRVFAREAPRLAEHNVKLIAISPSPPSAEGTEFLNEMGVDYAFLYDERAQIAENLGILHSYDYKGEHVPVPVSLLVDAQGILRYVSKPHDFSTLSSGTRVIELLEAGTP